MAILDSVLVPIMSFALNQLSRRRLPQLSGTLGLPGLLAPVDVIRDLWGVPHLYAQNLYDMRYAQGYVHAQDRLWQMDFQRRLVAGRLSEVLGSVTVQVDRWMRILSMRRVAEKEVHLLNAHVRSEVEAYAAGVNAYIDRGPLPVEFALLRYRPEPWQVADTLSWIKMMSWTLSVNWESEILRSALLKRIGPDILAELEPSYLDATPCICAWDGQSVLAFADAARPYVGPPPNAGLGSNNWVIAGSRTASGKPLLANDMHLRMTAPGIWYENHLSDGNCDITGVTFPGIPGVVAGHNTHVAWGFTNGFPDVQDLYIEHLRRRPDGGVEYEFRGEWLEAELNREQIRVKGADPVVEEVVVTRHGPIINQLAAKFSGEEPLALRWTSLEPDTMVHALHGMNCARNCLDLRDALRDWTAPVQNVVYADSEGNIGYSFPGKVPVRQGSDGQRPVPGWTGEHEWKGYVPYDELPHIYNPPSGYIVSANNRVIGDDYPHYLGREHCQGDRAQRIAEMIEAAPGKIDAGYIRRMQFDLISPTGREVARVLGRLKVSEPALVRAVHLMGEWNGELRADSAAAAIHEVFVRRFLASTLNDKLEDLTEHYMGKGPTPVLAEVSVYGERSLEWLRRTLADPDASWFARHDGDPAGDSASAQVRREKAIQRALQDTVDYLAGVLGPDIGGWSWGKLHTLTFNHHLGQGRALARVISRGPYPIGGDATTVWASGSSYHDLNSENVVGPPFRMIVDLAQPEDSLAVLVPGQSGNPSSPHYDDQIDAWFRGKYHPILYRRENVERVAEAALRLIPSGKRGAHIPLPAHVLREVT